MMAVLFARMLPILMVFALQGPLETLLAFHILLLHLPIALQFSQTEKRTSVIAMPVSKILELMVPVLI
jgi:hypothetical protein